MVQRGIVVLSLFVLIGFAVACIEAEDLTPKINSNIHIKTDDINFNDDEVDIDDDWTIGELVKDSTWTVENITAQSIYPKLDNQITFLGDDTIQLDWGGVAAIRTDTRFPVSEITCRLFSGGGSGLILCFEFERGGTLACSTVHILVSSVDKMTWVGYENISILRRVGEYCEDED